VKKYRKTQKRIAEEKAAAARAAAEA